MPPAVALAPIPDSHTALGAAAPLQPSPATQPVEEAWFPAFVEGFRLWMGDEHTPRDPQRAVPLLRDAARLGHPGSALLLATVFKELARNADERGESRDARTFTRLSIIYQTAAFWSEHDDPDVEHGRERQEHWLQARESKPEPRLWLAIDALSGADGTPNPLAALQAFDALAEQHPVHGRYLASVAAEEAAECSEDPLVALNLMERARAHLIRSAAAGNRAAQKRLFIARAGESRA
ncbi:TPA: hypothetical protein QDB01_000399 [Burkholderia vietnamiensis]|nr:hypothetical protein [Burkholderia vietnamiensis]